MEGHHCPNDHLEVSVNSPEKKFVCIRCDTFDTCPPGQGWPVNCNGTITEDTNIECLPCIPGESYSPEHGRTQCQPCHSITCLSHEKVNGNCTPENDSTNCTGVCEDGFCMNNNKTSCQPCCFSKSEKNKTLVKKCPSGGDDIPNKDSMTLVGHLLVGIIVPLSVLIGIYVIYKYRRRLRQLFSHGCFIRNCGEFITLNDKK